MTYLSNTFEGSFYAYFCFRESFLFILKKGLQHKCLHVNFGKFWERPTFVENLSGAAFGNAFLKTLLNDGF